MDPQRSEDIHHRMPSRSEAIRRSMDPRRGEGIRHWTSSLRCLDNGVRVELGKGAEQ
ncbi:hypothetical protein [Nonomuraea insulae]|uniref:Uncharacterized protein n=1 Tax=Nonomuraea insulae TaxID=1616787 RepID=A0ABW1D427_9ACTN